MRTPTARPRLSPVDVLVLSAWTGPAAGSCEHGALDVPHPHASLFTGRWPQERAAEWLSPLRRNFPTRAEYLGTHGYETAGFVANTFI